MNLVELALKLRPLIEQAAGLLDDKTASQGVQLSRKLKEDGALIKSGTRICWGNTLKRARVDLWDTAENNPDNAPALWEAVAYRDGYRIAPDAFTSTNAAANGEYIWFDGELFKSLKDGNVHTPAQAPEVWEKVSQ